MRKKSLLAKNSPATLLKYNVSGCLLIFIILEIWRPCYFLTDDNLTGVFPVLTEIGRHLKTGHSPFVSDYLFGGHYDLSRDPGCLFWHPFYLIPALLCDTPARFWILDITALLFLLLSTVGFTILTCNLRSEFKLNVPDIGLIFYTMSYVFSMYILMIAPSWISFLGNQSSLPWLTLGILDKKIFRGTALVALVSIHQFAGSYAAMTLSNTLLLTLFALGISVCRKSPLPFFIWCTGTLLGLLLISPLLVHVLDGFAHAARLKGLTPEFSSRYAVPAAIFPVSFFFGSWTEAFAHATGNLFFLSYPYVSTLLACAAAWCLIPASHSSSHWRPMQILCLGMAALIIFLIIRPQAVTDAMQHLPMLKSMRWPFREILQFLFFTHLFIILRSPLPPAQYRWLVPIYSLALFLLPLPFIHSPTLSLRPIDRISTFSGKADLFWNRVKPLLKPTDKIATVIDRQLWEENGWDIPYTYLGTANFPALYQITCVSGYSPTSPADKLPLKVSPAYWFGAFSTDQLDTILQECPDLKVIIIESAHPLKLSLYSKDSTKIDLTPYLPQ